MSDILINRVAASGIITIDLEDYYPKRESIIFDLKEYLFMEMVLKEKDFRAAMKNHDWSKYEGKILIVTCTADAIIPMWAYMLISSYATLAYQIWNGTENDYLAHHYESEIVKIDGTVYADKRVVIKGCGEKKVPPQAYISLSRKLMPFVKSLMFGEPCSTVPIYKQPIKK